jgi:GT2 family glycosyltransferase
VACGAIVRATAYESVGGFDARYGVGGEERHLAVSLASAGWELVYLDELVAHHHPDRGPRPGRSWRQLRNDVWSAWLHRPLAAALRGTARALGGAPAPVAARATVEAARGLPWVLRERRVVAPELEAELRLLDEP